MQPEGKEFWIWFACGVALGLLVYFIPYGRTETGIGSLQEFELRSLLASGLVLAGAFWRARTLGRQMPDWRWVVSGLTGVAVGPLAFFTLFLIECGSGGCLT